MTVLLILIGSLVTTLMFVLALRQFFGVLSSRRRAIGAAEFSRAEREFSLIKELNARLLTTRLGKWLARQLDHAGLSHSPILVLTPGIAAAGVGTYFLWRFISTILAVLGIGLGVLVVRRYLTRAQARRREAFIAQLPELARVLANASHAGLSLATAIGIAGTELPEPPGSSSVHLWPPPSRSSTTASGRVRPMCSCRRSLLPPAAVGPWSVPCATSRRPWTNARRLAER